MCTHGRRGFKSELRDQRGVSELVSKAVSPSACQGGLAHSFSVRLVNHTACTDRVHPACRLWEHRNALRIPGCRRCPAKSQHGVRSLTNEGMTTNHGHRTCDSEKQRAEWLVPPEKGS